MARTFLDLDVQAKLASATAQILAANAVTTVKILDANVTDAKLATPYIKADGTRAFTGNQSAGGFSVTNLSSPNSNNDAATKAYVDSVASGLSIKGSARALAVANVALAGTYTLDGVALTSGDRVLVTGQTGNIDVGNGYSKDNGIYVVAAGAWTRATDMATGSSASGSFAFIEEGTTYAQTGWVCNDPASAGVVGTNGLGFTQFTSVGGVSGSGAAGEVAYFTASGTISSNTNLEWDNTNKILSVGGAPITTLASVITVKGSTAVGFAAATATSGQNAFFTGIKAGGTISSPTATPVGELMVEFAANGHDGTDYDFNNAGGTIKFSATETWSPSAHGTDMVLKLCAAGSTAGVDVLHATAATAPTLAVGGDPTNNTFVQLEVKGSTQIVGVGATSYGTGNSSSFVGMNAGGSIGSQTATPSGNKMAQLIAIGHDGTAFDFSHGNGKIEFIAAETWSPSAHGVDMDIKLCQPGTQNNKKVVFYASLAGGVGRIGLGNAADSAGAGSPPAFLLDASTDESGVNAVVQYTLYSNTPGNTAERIRRARGTFSSPSAIQSGDNIRVLGGFGYGATGFASGPRASVVIQAAENWTDTAQGARIIFNTTPTGSATIAEAGRFGPGGNLGLGTTTPQFKIDLQKDGASAQMAMTSYGSTGGAQTAWIGRQAGGSQGSPTATQSGARLAMFIGEGWDTAFTNPTAGMEIRAEEAFTASAHGTSIRFLTTDIGSTSESTRVYIAAGGKAGFGGNTSPNYEIDVTGDANVSGVYRVGGTQLQSGAAGQVAYFNGGQTQVSSANLQWDNTNQILAIGRTPNTAVDGPYSIEAEGPIASVADTVGQDTFRAIGYGVSPVLSGYAANGTEASPTQSLNGDFLMFVGAKGHDGTNFSATGSRAAIMMLAAEDFTPTAQGTKIKFRVTAPGTVTNLNNAMVLRAASGSPQLGIGIASPVYALDASGDANVTGVYRVGGTQIGLSNLNGVTATNAEVNNVGQFVTREAFTGNGSTTVFTLAQAAGIITGSEHVYLNGLLQDDGGNDYSISAGVITFTTAPASAAKIRVSYRYH